MRILIIDDDKLVTSSLKTILESDAEITIAGTGNSGEEAILLYEQLLPDLLLMDIRMDKMTGLDAAECILSKHKDAKILLLTTFADDEYIIRALKIGVKGYILKQNFESISASVKTVFAGQSVFGDDVITKIPSLIRLGEMDKVPCSFDLTDRELAIINLVADGLSNKEIAAKLFLSEGTVRNYLSMILEKLELRDRTQLAVFYYKNLK